VRDDRQDFGGTLPVEHEANKLLSPGLYPSVRGVPVAAAAPISQLRAGASRSRGHQIVI